MFEFVIEQVGDYPVEETWVGQDFDCARAPYLDTQPLIAHAGLVKIDHVSYQLVEIHLASREPECIGFRLCHVQRCVKKFSQPVEFVDRRDD